MDQAQAHYVFSKVWGCKSHVKKLTSDKLAPKTDKYLFVGYPKETKGYYLYNPIENIVFVAQKVVFLEKKFIFKKNNGSKVELEEVQEPQAPIQDSVEMDTDSQEVVEPEPIAQKPRSFCRIRHELERYGFLINDDQSIVLVDQDELLPTVRQLKVQIQPSGLEPWKLKCNQCMTAKYRLWLIHLKVLRSLSANEF